MHSLTRLLHLLFLLLIPIQPSHSHLLPRSPTHPNTTAVTIVNSAPTYQGCQYPPSPPSKYIYFLDPSTPAFLFSIKTPWTLFYYSDVRQALVTDGFQISLSPQPAHLEAVCGWKHVSDVSGQGVWRGKITYKDLRVGVNDVEAYRRPGGLTLRTIKAIMLGTYPSMEMLYVLLFVAVVVGGAACFAWWYFASKREQEKRNLEKGDEIEGVEMVGLEEKKSGGCRNSGDVEQPPEYRWVVAHVDMGTPLPRYEAPDDGFSEVWLGESSSSMRKLDGLKKSSGSL